MYLKEQDALGSGRLVDDIMSFIRITDDYVSMSCIGLAWRRELREPGLFVSINFFWHQGYIFFYFHNNSVYTILFLKFLNVVRIGPKLLHCYVVILLDLVERFLADHEVGLIS